MNEQVRLAAEQELATLTERWEREWRALHQEPPLHLYHYTDAAGLHGIITSNRLWATDAVYLNDASELIHASKIIEQGLRAKKRNMRLTRRRESS